MTSSASGNLIGLVRELQRIDGESPWVEFKVNNTNPDEIGEYISALANSAAHVDKSFAYVAWGISDEAHEIVGTTFDPANATVGAEQLENWLLRGLSPKLDFTFLTCDVEGKLIVLLEIPRAETRPVSFRNNEFIRVGSYKKPLGDNPQIERELWRVFDRSPFETLSAAEHLPDAGVFEMLDVPTYFRLIGGQEPASAATLAILERDRMILRTESGDWNITNLGALTLAKRLDNFPRLSRKAVRVIQYPDNTRTSGIREQVGTMGYAVGFEGLIDYVRQRLPQAEVIDARRHVVDSFPQLAIRELIANALIHQDFGVGGAGPTVELFVDRVEITNPGKPLMDTERLLDNPPRSRNEALASFMRRAGICEERGSGVDKVVWETEIAQLPAPEFRVVGDNMTSTLFAAKALNDMEKADRIRAVYLHACLRWVNRQDVANTSIRGRFGIETQNAARATRLINEALEAGMIVPKDAAAGRKYMQYVPFWAGTTTRI